MTDIPGLTEQALESAIPASVRRCLVVHTLRDREQGRRQPEGPALALLRIPARHPRIIRENLRSAP